MLPLFIVHVEAQDGRRREYRIRANCGGAAVWWALYSALHIDKMRENVRVSGIFVC